MFIKNFLRLPRFSADGSSCYALYQVTAINAQDVDLRLITRSVTKSARRYTKTSPSCSSCNAFYQATEINAQDVDLRPVTRSVTKDTRRYTETPIFVALREPLRVLRVMLFTRPRKSMPKTSTSVLLHEEDPLKPKRRPFWGTPLVALLHQHHLAYCGEPFG